MVRIKRIYDRAAADDGMRILVDRLWPRGVSKDKAAIDIWLKEVAPSGELRTWFGHKPERFDEFRKRYVAELADNLAMDELLELAASHSTVTLLYSAKDPVMNQANVLKEYIEHRQ